MVFRGFSSAGLTSLPSSNSVASSVWIRPVVSVWSCVSWRRRSGMSLFLEPVSLHSWLQQSFCFRVGMVFKSLETQACHS
eukprot:symbB.v1.2.036346.t1/scaffold5111.1/size30776/2